jgi:hypothetical protein
MMEREADDWRVETGSLGSSLLSRMAEEAM